MTFRTRAFTMVELLVGLAVFSLLTGVIAAVFVVTSRYTRLYQQVSQGQREAVHCMREMTRELIRGSSETLRPVSAVNATWILSNLPPESSNERAQFSTVGDLLWHKWVGVWCRQDGEVDRSEILLAVARPFLQVDLSAGPSAISEFTTLARHRRLASCIRRFEVTADAHTITLDILSETQRPGNLPTRYHLASSFLAD